MNRGVVSSFDRRRSSVRITFGTAQVVIVLAVALAGAGPLYWVFKGSVSDTQELLSNPLAIWPQPTHWDNLTKAWTDLQIGHYLANTVVLVAGSWLCQVVVALTAGYALSILQPRYGRYLYGAILATLFVPGTVALVALYLVILDLPGLHVSIANTPFAVWLPAGAQAFNVLIAKQFFDTIPRELLEAARVDGAGSWVLFRRIVLPMSKPIIAVISLLAVMASWKDFLWPLVAITDQQSQPLSVALPRLAASSDQALLIAGLFIALLPPLLIFLIFQRQIVRGIGFTGVKG
ncbi:carbohydrate ABC transporter permease [Actinocrispum wychmicini]|uniref:Multiple sugar transport system permease protein n=1 Tax=Actinocrispum wychmicini TaxID=1213861 RepID=A0A4R2JG66_9PSEU|nr:carbohydrate ABC transporter permease [Actinocrispum wychmicini]TCO55896.1 multiple sugar transport system permease protein [Actinocrispum wychmicini]